MNTDSNSTIEKLPSGNSPSVQLSKGALVKRLTSKRLITICKILAKVVRDPRHFFKAGESQVDIEAVKQRLVVALNKMQSHRIQVPVTVCDLVRWLSKHKQLLVKFVESINKKETVPLSLSKGVPTKGRGRPRFVCTVLKEGIKLRLKKVKEAF